MAEPGSSLSMTELWSPPASIDEARARARERFKSRLESGQHVGACGCGEDAIAVGVQDGSTVECVVGVRFRDSGRVYYFRPEEQDLEIGDWVVVATSRGQESAQVVITPHQVRQSMLQGELGTVLRRLDDEDAGRIAAQKAKSADAVKVFGERARARRLGIKIIAASYAFDGRAVTLNYAVPDRERGPDSGALRELARELARELDCRVELLQVGPRDEARLLGGLGRCGRTLCCSSWLPVYPEISMGMAKNQDLPLNPAKVSGVCGRLLCCLSYENEQYRQMKAVMPRLGQPIDSPVGRGQVVSLQVLKELVTIRLADEHQEVTFRADELDFAPAQAVVPPPLPAAAEPVAYDTLAVVLPANSINSKPEDAATVAGGRRRRRRGGRRGSGKA